MPLTAPPAVIGGCWGNERIDTMEFKSGQTLYTRQGATVTFDHVHNGMAFVCPTIKVEYHSGYGEDAYEETGYEPSESLISVDPKELFGKPPVDLIDADIADRKAKLSSAETALAKFTRESAFEKSKLERSLASAKSQLERWQKEHQLFVDLGRLLDGDEMFPLNIEPNPYHKSHSVPMVPALRDIKFIQLDYNSYDKETPWRVNNRMAGDRYTFGVRFFDSEADRDDYVSDRFIEVCAAFRKNPSYETTPHTRSTTLHFGTISQWVERFPFLTMPSEFEAGKLEHDATLRDAEKQRLSDQIKALEATS